MRDLVLDSAAIAGVLTAPLCFGLAGRFGGAYAATITILGEIALLTILDWYLGVSGAFIYVVAAGIVIFLVVGGVERRARRTGPSSAHQTD